MKCFYCNKTISWFKCRIHHVIMRRYDIEEKAHPVCNRKCFDGVVERFDDQDVYTFIYY